MHSTAFVPSHRARRQSAAPLRLRQAGLTLVEMMVGIGLGLLVVAIALGAIVVSSSASSNVSDSTQLQQQAAYAFRVLGQQIRQAGSLELNLYIDSPSGTQPAPSAAAKVGFQVGYTGWGDIVAGAEGTDNDTLTVGYSNYFEPQVDAASTSTLFRNCLGQGGRPDPNGTYSPILNEFKVVNGPDGEGPQLVCSAGTQQNVPIIRNVSDFQVRYFVQNLGTSGQPTVHAVQADGVTNWADVVAVEVCLDLVGDKSLSIDDALLTAGYRNCSGAQANFNNRLHQVFRNVYQIRSQGTLGLTQ